jgi:predicted DNA-binding protein
MVGMMKRIPIRFDSGTANRLNDVADTYGLSIANIIRQLVEEHLDEFERKLKEPNVPTIQKI